MFAGSIRMRIIEIITNSTKYQNVDMLPLGTTMAHGLML